MSILFEWEHYREGSAGIATQGAASATTLLTGISDGDSFGQDIVASDLNGDGYADLIVGAEGFSGSSDQGQVALFLSRGAAGIATQGAATASARITGGDVNDLFGTALNR